MSFYHFTKAEADELARLEELLSRSESRVRRAFAEFVRDVSSEDVIRVVADRLEAGDVEGALAIADSYVNRLAAVIPEIFRQAGNSEVQALAAAVAALNPTVAISFNPTDPEAALLMRANLLEFVREFTDAQREATRAALSEALQTGAGRQEAARLFRDSIGLTRRQLSSVEGYRTALGAQSRQALDRVLRDRRFDPSVQRMASTGEPLSAEKIDRMVARYRARVLAQRAETIARTESVRTISEARGAAFRQTIGAAGIPAEQTEQIWRSVHDNRTRETHRELDGQVRPLDQPFQSPSGAQLRYPGDPAAPAAEVINCRCHRTFRIKSPDLMAVA